MAYVETGGLYWPFSPHNLPFATSAITLDAATEKAAHIGRLAMNAHPGATKTLDTSGSSKIAWQGGSTAVFDDGASSLDVGIQGVGTAGPTAVPDGSYSVKAVVTTAANASPTLTTTNSWHTVTPTTGTVTLTEGDLIAVVWDLTARGGTDSILITHASQSGFMLPVTNAYASSAWGAAGVGAIPSVLITFSDGTLGWIDGAPPIGLAASLTWTDATNPDEQGMIFQVPFDCKVDALTCMMRTVDGTSDFTMYLSSGVSSGSSTRSQLAIATIDATQLGVVAGERFTIFRLATQITLTANTDYCVSLKATGAGNVRFNQTTIGAAAIRAAFSSGTNLFGTTANASGEFGAGSSTVMYPLGVRISQISTGSGGMRTHPGLNGGING